MRCTHCGGTLKKGCVFCSFCGKEIQIVPDYNEFDDEYLNNLVSHNVEEDNELEKIQQNQKKEKEFGKHNSRKKIFIILTAAFLFAIVLGGFALSLQIKFDHETSYNYQIRQARKALENGQEEEAIVYFEKALAIDSNDLESRYSLAELNRKTGNIDVAIKYYTEIIQMDAECVDAFQQLLTIYEKQKNLDKILRLKDMASTNREKAVFAEYVIGIPEFDKKEGDYPDFMNVGLYTSDESKIYYTVDGTNPITAGILYQNPIRLDEEKTYTIQAVCQNAKGMYSDIVRKVYTIYIAPPKMPEVTPNGGSFVTETTVLVHVPINCVAYYTWNGKNPNENSTKYKGHILVPEGNNILSVILYDYTTKKFSDIYRGRFEYYSQ